MDRRLARSLVGLQADLERSMFASAVLGMWLQCSICGLTRECPRFLLRAVMVDGWTQRLEKGVASTAPPLRLTVVRVICFFALI